MQEKMSISKEKETVNVTDDSAEGKDETGKKHHDAPARKDPAEPKVHWQDQKTGSALRCPS